MTTTEKERTREEQREEQESLYNKVAEEAVIGTLLFDNNTVEILDFLRPEHFYVPLSGELFKKIQIAHENQFAVTRDSLIEDMIKNKDEKTALSIKNHIRNCFSSGSYAVNPVGMAKHIIDLYVKRQLVRISQQTIYEVTENRDSTAEILIEEAEHKLFRVAQEESYKKDFEKFDVLTKRSIETIEHNYRHQDIMSGLSTGFIDLDKLLGGLQKSDLVILAGRPSMGKTALAVNMAVNAAEVASKNGESIGFFSLEMSAEQLTGRIISMYTGINSFNLRSGRITEAQYGYIMEKYRDLSKLNLFIDDTAGLRISALRSRARTLARKSKNKLRAIFVDYLQLLRGTMASSNANRVNEVGEITQELKNLAKELDIPIIALSQLSRMVEQRDDKRPLLSDLRESGSIEQDADVVMFIYREEYYIRRKQPKEGTEEHTQWQKKMDDIMNQAEIIISKQRNGPIGNVKLFYDSNITVFKDIKI